MSLPELAAISVAEGCFCAALFSGGRVAASVALRRGAVARTGACAPAAGAGRWRSDVRSARLDSAPAAPPACASERADSPLQIAHHGGRPAALRRPGVSRTGGHAPRIPADTCGAAELSGILEVGGVQQDLLDTGAQLNRGHLPWGSFLGLFVFLLPHMHYWIVQKRLIP